MKTIYTGEQKIVVSDKLLAEAQKAAEEVHRLSRNSLWEPSVDVLIPGYHLDYGNGYQQLFMRAEPMGKGVVMKLSYRPETWKVWSAKSIWNDLIDNKDLRGLPDVYFTSAFVRQTTPVLPASPPTLPRYELVEDCHWRTLARRIKSACKRGSEQSRDYADVYRGLGEAAHAFCNKRIDCETFEQALRLAKLPYISPHQNTEEGPKLKAKWMRDRSAFLAQLRQATA